MKIIKAGYQILSDINVETIYKQIERAARTCYKSEGKIKEGSAEKMVKNLVKSGHEAMLEHAYLSVRFTVDRGVSHEIVRHRLAAYAQESTRYCNYGGSGITVIEPCYLIPGTAPYKAWQGCCQYAEDIYISLLNAGFKPEEARAVLPMSLKTEIVVTADLRAWRHILKLRAVGTTGKPHVQIEEVMQPLLIELREKLPAVFGDLELPVCEECMVGTAGK